MLEDSYSILHEQLGPMESVMLHSSSGGSFSRQATSREQGVVQIMHPVVDDLPCMRHGLLEADVKMQTPMYV